MLRRALMGGHRRCGLGAPTSTSAHPQRSARSVAASADAGASATSAASLLPPELADFRPCVGVTVVNREGKVFAAQRVDDPVPDSWQMPQGGIDPGESPKDAAVRELFEETSIRPDRVEFVAEIPEWLAYEFPTEVRCTFTGAWANYKGQAQRWFLFVYRGGDSEVDLDTPHGREFKAWRWADVDELPGRVIPFKRAVYERVAAEFGPRIEALRAAGDLLGVAE